jgi:2-(1,2-epoxy-1,2-dihydrophenyl)acetyl-CoA isomerase
VTAEQPDWQGFEDLLVEQRGGVLIVTLNRPETLNALTAGMRAGLRRIVAETPQHEDVRALVITGAGRGFCSGADFSAGAGPGYYPPSTRAERLDSNFVWLERLRALDIPVIAAVNGAAAGAGMAIACACDVRIMDAGARLHTGFVRRGLGPDNALSWTLPRLTGAARALLLMWSGDPIPAEEALRFGIVEQIAAPGESLNEALALAGRLADGPALAIAAIKRAVYRGLTRDMGTHAEWEQLAMSMLRETDDAREGRLSFQEGRPARFGGR